MRIGDLQNCSLTDFPGKVAAVVFTQGCNLRCPYCQTASLVIPECFEKPIPEEEVLARLERRKDRLEGVVITGGEPTLHADLPRFIEKVRALGFAIKLDTNGTRPDLLHSLIRDGLLDYIAMDIKAPLLRYSQTVGRPVAAEVIRRSIWILRNSRVDHEFRTTAVPGIHTVRELKAIVNLIDGAECFVLQEFVSQSPLQRGLIGRPAFPRRTIEELRPYMERRVKRFEIRIYDEAVKMPVGKRRRASQAASVGANA